MRDTVGGSPVMVSFCTACRTGRVFAPVVDGRAEPSVSPHGPLQRDHITGRAPNGVVASIDASQEFWHAGRPFQPATKRD